MNRLTAIAGSCGPGSLHFINGVYEANRNRAPVILIASQVVRRELGSDFIQEVDFESVYRGCSVFCKMLTTPESARRLTVLACQAAITKRGVAVIILPVDVADAPAADELPFSLHVNQPVIRPSDADLDRMAGLLAAGNNITIYAGSGCVDAHDEVVQLAGLLQAPVAHTSRGKDQLAYDNPHNVGMTGVIGAEAGYNAILNCDLLIPPIPGPPCPPMTAPRAQVVNACSAGQFAEGRAGSARLFPRGHSAVIAGVSQFHYDETD